ncbi:acyl-CoA thioesterase [Pelagibacterium montanilacus]|uniref:acyl-CoA thioesterase n=1 Tax=Pelagibacterium montanilacus TaxID=2185280 RepID=UPI000F8C6B47|nr:acyl-CoA thioesterase [Pelagibacterium montanilacus]
MSATTNPAIPTQPDPKGALTIRTMAMPADTNAAGDIFGGWVMSQMDIAGAIAAVEYVGGRVATVAVEAMSFIAPIHVGDVLCIYTWIDRVGTTSIKVGMESWAKSRANPERIKVTEGHFIYVALGEDGNKRQIEKPSP